MPTVLRMSSVRSTSRRIVTAVVFGWLRLTVRPHRGSSRQATPTRVRRGPLTVDSWPSHPSAVRPTRSTPCTSYPSMDRVKSSPSVPHRRSLRRSPGHPMEKRSRTFSGHPAPMRTSLTIKLDRRGGSHDSSPVSTVRGGRTIGQTTFGSCRLTAHLRPPI